MEPLLRSLERTGGVQEAIDHIRALGDKDWSLTTELEIRWAALLILAEYASRHRHGVGPSEVAGVKMALGSLANRLAQDLQDAARLETEAADRGIKLDPTKRGGGSRRTRRAGRPSTLLADYVTSLLRDRYPEWDGVEAFPRPNSQALRNWLCQHVKEGRGEDLLARRFGIWWNDAYPFSPADIDPANKGPLWAIVNRLKNPQ